MKIEMKSDKKETVGEMLEASGEMGHLVSEMITEPAKLADFGFPQEIIDRAQSVSADDDTRQFAVVRVEAGWSGSGRLWPAREIDRIVAQTNVLEPVGHLGHIPDEDESTSMPDPQTTWVGAIAKDEPSEDKALNGATVRVAYFAGYNYPPAVAKIRELIKRRGVRGISWWGRAHQVPVPGKGVEMKDFDLKHLDWARKGAEGMPTSRIAAIASEMKEGDKMAKELSQVTPAELREEAPNTVALLRAEFEGEHKELVSEMEGKLTKAQEAESLLQEILKALKIDDPAKALEAITTLMTKLGDRAKAVAEKLMDELLGEKVKDDQSRALVKGLLQPVLAGEMETRVSEAKDEEDAKKIVGEMLDEQFNTNDLIKTVVGEQTTPNIRRKESLRDLAGGSGDNNEYMADRESRAVGA